jgi:hypothetical protein
VRDGKNHIVPVSTADKVDKTASELTAPALGYGYGAVAGTGQHESNPLAGLVPQTLTQHPGQTLTETL